MELTWWVVAICGCVGLALCVAAAMYIPIDSVPRRYRLLANVERLTRLPEYRRAMRVRRVATAVAIALSIIAFAGSLIAGARPTGLHTGASTSVAGQPEDIMVCVGGPGTDPAVGATLRYFADQVNTFSTQRIGLTSAHRRVVPLTRDYQFAAARFGEYADSTQPAVAISYADYAGGVEDVLAMCLTGFPSVEKPAAQRRSLIYIGPGSLRPPDETRPALYTADAVGEFAKAAGVQINALTVGSSSPVLDALAGQTGGSSFSANSDVVTHAADIRQHPPQAMRTAAEAARVRSVETPDIPVIFALSALTALLAWRAASRR